jgi:MFS family permease
MGIMYIELPLFFAFLKSFPKLRLWATPVGMVIMCLSLALSSFATSVNHLILTQGVMYAIGGGFAWVPILFYVEEWFEKRRSLAYGVIMVMLHAFSQMCQVPIIFSLGRTCSRRCRFATDHRMATYLWPPHNSPRLLTSNIHPLSTTNIFL